MTSQLYSQVRTLAADYATKEVSQLLSDEQIAQWVNLRSYQDENEDWKLDIYDVAIEYAIARQYKYPDQAPQEAQLAAALVEKLRRDKARSNGALIIDANPVVDPGPNILQQLEALRQLIARVQAGEEADLANYYTIAQQDVRDEAQDAAIDLKADQTALTTEEQARETADTALGVRIDGEVTARTNADTALGTRIDGKADSSALSDYRTNAEQTPIDAEQTAAIDQEVADREHADTTHVTNLPHVVHPHTPQPHTHTTANIANFASAIASHLVNATIAGQVITFTQADGTTDVSVTIPVASGGMADGVVTAGRYISNGEVIELTVTDGDITSTVQIDASALVNDATLTAALALKADQTALASEITNRQNLDTRFTTHAQHGNPLTLEQVRDAVAGFLRQGTGISITHNDAGDALTISSTVVNTDTQLSTEQVQDMVAAFLQEGDNVTLTYDDAANTLTITATGGGGAGVDQTARDLAAAAQTLAESKQDTLPTLTEGQLWIGDSSGDPVAGTAPLGGGSGGPGDLVERAAITISTDYATYTRLGSYTFTDLADRQIVPLFLEAALTASGNLSVRASLSSTASDVSIVAAGVFSPQQRVEANVIGGSGAYVVSTGLLLKRGAGDITVHLWADTRSSGTMGTGTLYEEEALTSVTNDDLPDTPTGATDQAPSVRAVASELYDLRRDEYVARIPITSGNPTPDGEPYDHATEQGYLRNLHNLFDSDATTYVDIEIDGAAAEDDRKIDIVPVEVPAPAGRLEVHWGPDVSRHVPLGQPSSVDGQVTVQTSANADRSSPVNLIEDVDVAEGVSLYEVAEGWQHILFSGPRPGTIDNVNARRVYGVRFLVRAASRELVEDFARQQETQDQDIRNNSAQINAIHATLHPDDHPDPLEPTYSSGNAVLSFTVPAGHWDLGGSFVVHMLTQPYVARSGTVVVAISGSGTSLQTLNWDIEHGRSSAVVTVDTTVNLAAESTVTLTAAVTSGGGTVAFVHDRYDHTMQITSHGLSDALENAFDNVLLTQTGLRFQRTKNSDPKDIDLTAAEWLSSGGGGPGMAEQVLDRPNASITTNMSIARYSIATFTLDDVAENEVLNLYLAVTPRSVGIGNHNFLLYLGLSTGNTRRDDADGELLGTAGTISISSTSPAIGAREVLETTYFHHSTTTSRTFHVLMDLEVSHVTGPYRADLEVFVVRSGSGSGGGGGGGGGGGVGTAQRRQVILYTRQTGGVPAGIDYDGTNPTNAGIWSEDIPSGSDSLRMATNQVGHSGDGVWTYGGPWNIVAADDPNLPAIQYSLHFNTPTWTATEIAARQAADGAWRFRLSNGAWSNPFRFHPFADGSELEWEAVGTFSWSTTATAHRVQVSNFRIDHVNDFRLVVKEKSSFASNAEVYNVYEVIIQADSMLTPIQASGTLDPSGHPVIPSITSENSMRAVWDNATSGLGWGISTRISTGDGTRRGKNAFNFQVLRPTGTSTADTVGYLVFRNLNFAQLVEATLYQR